MKRAALLSIVIIVIGLAAYLLTVKPAAPPAPSAVSPQAAIAVAPAAPPAPATKMNVPPPAPNVSPAFTAFLLQDSKQLESMNVDSVEAEKRENETAAKMGEPEVSYARELALTSQAPANQRILAVDLLGRAPSRLTGQALDDIITKGMNSARAEPHTVEELSNVQAKAFAVMAVDAIADKAATEPAERAHLQMLFAQATDSTIKRHIAERIRSLPPL
jgi:hypothetical protein